MKDHIKKILIILLIVSIILNVYFGFQLILVDQYNYEDRFFKAAYALANSPELCESIGGYVNSCSSPRNCITCAVCVPICVIPD